MALAYKPKLTRFTRQGERLGRIDVDEAVHVENLDGTDELTITTGTDLGKGDYIVWFDRAGRAHEHIVDEPVRLHDSDGRPYTQATCINSVAETWDDWVDDLRPEGSMATALRSFLGVTRWELGTVSVGGSGPCHAYHTSAREAIAQAFETYGGELETEIVVLGDEVTARRLSALAARGDQASAKRFTWTKDLISVKRTVGSSNPKSRVYGYGKGVETDSGGYGRRLNFADINGGREYVEDAQATQLWGKPDALGNIMPACGVYINDECEDTAQLLQETRAYLDAHKAPDVTYEADVLDLVSFGRDWEDVGLGDSVAIIDREFSDDGLRLQGRVSQIERDLLGGDVKVTFGTLSDVLVDRWTATSQALKAISDRILNSVDTMFSEYWLNALQERMNDVFAASGTYVWSSFDKGWIFSTVPLDANGKATRTPASAMNITGSGFRIADSLTASGDWDWQNFGTGAGFLLNCLVAGTLTAGRIQSADGYDYWDLDNNELRISARSSVGGRTVSNLLDTVDATITDVDVEYAQNQDRTTAPQAGWSTAAPAWQSGWYIWQRTATRTAEGVTYSTPVCISGRDGADGSQGASGVGISSTAITYGKSSSESTQPASWQASVPALLQGEWLWVKTVYTYTDSATETVYTKSYVGTDGDDGTSVFVQSATKSGDTTTVVIADSEGHTSTLTIVDGQDGTNGTAGANGYVHTAWATSADGSQGFSTSVSAGKTYLGVYTDHTQADSQSYADYSWSLIKGSDGADGIGITSIVEQYYLSDSSTTQTGGSWSSTQPTWTSEKYIWTRSEITWDTTPATTTTTAPILATALTQANSQAKAANEAATANTQTLRALQTQQAIFNLLTDNGTIQGLFMQNGQLYVSADYIHSGTLALGGANNANGTLAVYDAGGNDVTAIDAAGAVLWHLCKLLDTTVTRGALFEVSEIETTSDRLFMALTHYSTTADTYHIPAVKVSATGAAKTTTLGNIYIVPRVNINSNYENYYLSTIYSDAPLQLFAGIDVASTNSKNPTLFVGSEVAAVMYGSMPWGSTGASYNTSISAFYALEQKALICGQSIELKNSQSVSAGFVYESNTLTITGDFLVSGNKTRLVETDNYADRLLYAYETPTPMFGDVGSGVIGEDGCCYVEIDDIFGEASRTDIAYQVFLQKCGQGDLWVAEKTATHFVVEGTPGLPFDWEIKAKQRGCETLRLEDNQIYRSTEAALSESTPESCYENELTGYLQQIEEAYAA